MSEKDNAVAQEVTTAPSLKALHALILDGDLTDAARMCDQLMAEQERREVDCGSIPVSARAECMPCGY